MTPERLAHYIVAGVAVGCPAHTNPHTNPCCPNCREELTSMIAAIIESERAASESADASYFRAASESADASYFRALYDAINRLLPDD